MIKQWVNNIISYSSEVDSKNWKATNIIGKPTVYPNYGSFKGTWSPLDGKEEFIEIKFKENVFVKKLKIYETNNPGFIYKISSKNEQGNWTVLYNDDRLQITKKQSRAFSPKLKRTKFLTNEIRIDINCQYLTNKNDSYEIDAIQLIGTMNEEEKDILTLESISKENSLNISRKYEKYINDENESDCSIFVGNEKYFNVMKIILVSQSEFFEGLFFSEMIESQRSYITLPSIKPDLFEEILFFLYTGDLKEENLQYEKLIKLLYSSDYLQLYGLIDLCFSYLSELTDLFLDSIDFLNLSEGLLIYYLKSDYLIIQEYHLFQKLVEWSIFQCRKFNIERTNQNIQQILNPLLFHLRLTLLEDKIKEIESCGYVSKKFLVHFYKSLIKKNQVTEKLRMIGSKKDSL
eukprot:gene9951-2272_t